MQHFINEKLVSSLHRSTIQPGSVQAGATKE